jgi:hypothetical protein
MTKKSAKTLLALTPERVWLLMEMTMCDQACRNPMDWPSVYETMTEGRRDHGSRKALWQEASAAIASAIVDGPPTDPMDVVWRVFPQFDREHRAELVELLLAECPKQRAAAE